MHLSNFESRKNFFIPFFPPLLVRFIDECASTSFGKILTVFAIETERSFWFIYAWISETPGRRLSNKIFKDLRHVFCSCEEGIFFQSFEKF